MVLNIAPLIFLSLAIIFSLLLAYNYKNLLWLLFSSIMCFLLGFSIWNGGIVQYSGSLISGNVSSSVVSLVSTDVMTEVNLGFSQNYLALTMVLIGILLFVQSIGGFANGGKFE